MKIHKLTISSYNAAYLTLTSSSSTYSTLKEEYFQTKDKAEVRKVELHSMSQTLGTPVNISVTEIEVQ